MNDPFLVAVNEWIVSPYTWLGLAVAAFLGVWWAKLTATMSNLTLTFGVVAGAVFIFHLPWLSSQPIPVRCLFSIASLVILGSGAYFTLWATYVPIAITAWTTPAIQSAGTTIGGVPWAPCYTEVRLSIANKHKHDYRDIDIVLRPDQAVTAAGQVTNVEGVSISVHDEPSMILEEFSRSGVEPRVSIPIVTLASTGGFRLRCAVLPRKSSLEIVMAAVTLHDGPAERDGDRLLRVNFKDGATIWYAHPGYSTRVFRSKPAVTSITIEGQYMAGERSVTVAEVLPIGDYATTIFPDLQRKLQQR